MKHVTSTDKATEEVGRIPNTSTEATWSEKHHLLRGVWLFYDFLTIMAISVLFLWVYPGQEKLTLNSALLQGGIASFSIIITRILVNVYRQMWRYGGVQSYIRLLVADACAFFVYVGISVSLALLQLTARVTLVRMLSFISLITLAALSIRLIYRYVYKCRYRNTLIIRVLCWIAYCLTGRRIDLDPEDEAAGHQIKIAIVGAGRVGVNLASELFGNPHASYQPRCFIDINLEKVGSMFLGLPVLDEERSPPRNCKTTAFRKSSWRCRNWKRSKNRSCTNGIATSAAG